MVGTTFPSHFILKNYDKFGEEDRKIVEDVFAANFIFLLSDMTLY